MTRRLPHLVIAALALVLPGCSYHCHFEARGVVRDADGKPIPDARVEVLDADGKPHVQNSGEPAVATTDADGAFRVGFWTVPSQKDELTGWTVKVSAEGHEPQTIAVGPVKEPRRGDVTVYLDFQPVLRKAR